MTGRDSGNELETLLRHRFAAPELLAEALRHSSAASGGLRSFERMEFLGDRVLGLIVADMLIARFPGEKEGDLAKRLAVLVNRDTLRDVALEIGLDRHIETAHELANEGVRRKTAMLSDGCEAVIGALFLDGGLEAARGFVAAYWSDRMEIAAPPRHAKSQLQEWALSRGMSLPVYRVVEREGPPHGPVFTVEVTVEGQPPASAKGGSKRAAEQAAARILLEQIDG